VWARGSLNQRQYATSPDVNGFFHNSYGYDVVGGIAIDFGGITSVEAFAGYIQQTYYDPRYSPVSVPTFGLTGYWNPLKEFLIKPFIRRTVDDTALSTAAAYIWTSYGVDANYDIRPNIRAEGHFDYGTANYLPQAGVATTEYDQYITARLGVMYLPTRNFFV